MKHGIKRWLCLFLTAVMLMSLFPAAYAAETEDEAEITTSTMAINREAERILSMLDQKDRDLLSLRLAAQLSFAEIAEIMEISQKAATERYRRLLNRCRKLTEGKSMSDF